MSKKKNHGDTEIGISCCLLALSDFRQRWLSQSDVHFVPCIWHLGGCCLLERYQHSSVIKSIKEVCSPQRKQVTKLEEERMLGSMTISVLLCCCPLMSFCPSGTAVCLSDSLKGMEGQQHLTNPCRGNPRSSFEVQEWNLLSSLGFCLTPTLIRIVLGLFCVSGLWSHTDSWKTLLSGFAFLLKSDTSEVWKEGSARSGSPAPCHMETLLFRVSLVQKLEELPLPLRQGSTA